ncbi:MAG: alpha/beta hydrolase [Alphaproteobacteria bacterium]|nr:MAG: alpha/beta hydrolase [Alphaproteobacteria bacterium]
MAASPQMQEIIDQLTPDPDAPVEAPTVQGIRDMMSNVLLRPAEFSDVTVIPVSAAGVAAEWLVHKDADPDKRLAYVHGGGYVAGDINGYRTFASDLSQTAGVAVLNIDYRLAPEHTGSAAFDDALAAYGWMLENGPNGAGAPTHCFMGGDSAGGGLALATMMGARDAGLPVPTAGILLSPWADMLASGESFQSNAATDPMVQKGALEWMSSLFLPQEDDLKDPRWSPLYGNFDGLPPLLIQVSAIETLLDDANGIAERARAAGVDVTFEAYPDVVHVWQTLGRDIPESSKGIDRICDYIREKC